MLSLLTFGSSVCREAWGCVSWQTGSPETVWLELSLIGHVTSLGQFLPLKPETRIRGGWSLFIFMFLHLNAARLDLTISSCLHLTFHLCT